MRLKRLKRDWDDLGDADPLWAVLTAKAGKHGKWNVDDFFQTGENEIASAIDDAQRLGFPTQRELALDFGCGVGRLTRALAKRFRRCYGVDISERMVAEARKLNDSCSNCEFVVNTEDTLRMFPDDHFDLIYSTLTLQHIPSRPRIKSYLREFVRTLREDGLLIFGLLNHIPILQRVQPRRRLYAILRSIGVDRAFLYERLGLYPIAATFVHEEEVVLFLRGVGATVLETRSSRTLSGSRQTSTYFVTKHRE